MTISIVEKILQIIRKHNKISRDVIFKKLNISINTFNINMEDNRISQYHIWNWIYLFQAIKQKLSKWFLDKNIKWWTSSFIEIKKSVIISEILDLLDKKRLIKMDTSYPLEFYPFSTNLFFVWCQVISNKNWWNLWKIKWNTWKYIFDINKKTMYVVNIINPREIKENIYSIDDLIEYTPDLTIFQEINFL